RFTLAHEVSAARGIKSLSFAIELSRIEFLKCSTTPNGLFFLVRPWTCPWKGDYADFRLPGGAARSLHRGCASTSHDIKSASTSLGALSLTSLCHRLRDTCSLRRTRAPESGSLRRSVRSSQFFLGCTPANADPFVRWSPVFFAS